MLLQICAYSEVGYIQTNGIYSNLQRASPLRELSVTCRPAEVTFHLLPQPVEGGIATSEESKAEFIGLVTSACCSDDMKCQIYFMVGLFFDFDCSTVQRQRGRLLPAFGQRYSRNYSIDSNQILLNNEDQVVLIVGCAPGANYTVYNCLVYFLKKLVYLPIKIFQIVIVF